MNKYGKLLSRIADEYEISKGTSEDIDRWKVRIIYSLLGQMALASLFDGMEDKTVSINHFKKRIETVFFSYSVMYPEIRPYISKDASELSKEIYDIYLNTGVIYHKPNRITAAPSAECISDKVCFFRGHAIEEKYCISGLGSFQILEDNEDTQRTLSDMFSLEPEPLEARWVQYTDSVNWKEARSEQSVKFLREQEPFRNGYWTDIPDKGGGISILRSGFREEQLYYLYKYEGARLFISQLPGWRIKDYQYRSLANACLYCKGVLPAAKYHYDGNLVNISFGYLPPPAELNLWKLYTWPASCFDFPRDFNRICSGSVFEAIKQTMEQLGYCFIEE